MSHLISLYFETLFSCEVSQLLVISLVIRWTN